MKRCIYCGRSNADEAEWCRECGTRFRPEPAQLSVWARITDGQRIKSLLSGIVFCLSIVALAPALFGTLFTFFICQHRDGLAALCCVFYAPVYIALVLSAVVLPSRILLKHGGSRLNTWSFWIAVGSAGAIAAQAIGLVVLLHNVRFHWPC
jgi:hypothetical protein